MLETNRVVAVPEKAANAKRCVSSGHNIHDQSLFIVDPQTCRLCAAGQVGEIWVCSQSVANGYWRQPESTRQTFVAELDTGSAKVVCLRTGDLGFVDEGELYVTGRQKDLIILHGRNIYPQDVELISQSSHPSLRPNAAAAFSMECEGSEALTVVQELEFRQKPDLQEVLTSIKEALGQVLTINPHAIVVVKPGGIPRTSSGKIRRRQCKTLYMNGELSSVAEWRREQHIASDFGAREREAQRQETGPAQSDYDVAERTGYIRQMIVESIAASLNVDANQIASDATFASLGLSSVDAVQLTAVLEDSLGLALSPTLAWNYPTVEELADYLAKELSAKGSSSSVERHLPTENLDLRALPDDELYRLLAKEIECAKHLSDQVLAL
jgi:acyl carrier protein